MTNEEKNAVSAGLLVLSNAAEKMMRFWLLMEKHVLTGQSKHFFNEMQHGVQHAQIYYSRFLESYEENLMDMDKDYGRVEEIRKNAAFMTRLFLITLNLNNNGIGDDEIEKMLMDRLYQVESPEMFVSQEIINKFVIR